MRKYFSIFCIILATLFLFGDVCQTGMLSHTRRIYGLYEDETGASFWPTYPGMIAFDGSAAIRFEGVDISPFAGIAGTFTPYLIRVFDSSDYECYGYLTEADATEALGSELITASDDSDFTVWGNVNWAGYSAGVPGDGTGKMEVTLDAGQSGVLLASANFSALTTGKFYRFRADIWQGTTTVTAFRMLVNSTPDIERNITISGTQTTFDLYFVVPDTVVDIRIFQLSGDDTKTFFVDDVSIKEVTALGADGTHVVSTKNGSTQNWASKHASFDYNDSSGYTFEIRRADFK